MDGAILRVDPDTGDALPDNPNAGSSEAAARRIVAYGFRNPFRMTVRPGTNEVWAGRRRLDRPRGDQPDPDPDAAGMRNHGWPCYEGEDRQGGYDGLNLSTLRVRCTRRATPRTVQPYFRYNHGQATLRR